MMCLALFHGGDCLQCMPGTPSLVLRNNSVISGGHSLHIAMLDGKEEIGGEMITMKQSVESLVEIFVVVPVAA